MTVPPCERLNSWIIILEELRSHPQPIGRDSTYRALADRGWISGPKHRARLSDRGRTVLSVYDLGRGAG